MILPYCDENVISTLLLVSTLSNIRTFFLIIAETSFSTSLLFSSISSFLGRAHSSCSGGPLTINQSVTVSPVLLDKVKILSSAPVIRMPSEFQYPVFTFLECFPTQGILRWFCLLKNTKDPFSVPMAKTGLVEDHFMNDAKSFLEGISISVTLLVPGFQTTIV